MESFILSKSTYIRGLQCLKSLYLNKHRPYLRDRLSEEQLAKFVRGQSFGKSARQLFPGGIEIQRPGMAAVEKTRKLVSEGFRVLYEACFLYDEVIVAVDLLVKNEESWNAYEVKSSGSLSETYYKDALLQEFVLRGSGLKLDKFFLVYRNPAIEIGSEVAEEMLIFKELDQTSESSTNEIREKIHVMKETILMKNSPVISPGTQCMYPYPCDFRGVCWKTLTDQQKSDLIEGKQHLANPENCS